MENIKVFEDMPEAPTPPKLPRYFPDLQGENRGRTPCAGWYQNDFLPWIQNQDTKTLFGIILLAVIAVMLGLGIHKYQDQIKTFEFSNNAKEIFRNLKEKIWSMNLAVGTAVDDIVGKIRPASDSVQEIEESNQSAMDKFKKIVHMRGQSKPESDK